MAEELPDYMVKGGAPKDPDMPDFVEAVYVSVKNTWQDAENLDGTYGYTTYIWIPEETFKVQIMKLHVYAEKFRAYSKAAKSSGVHNHQIFDVVSFNNAWVDPPYYKVVRFYNASGSLITWNQRLGHETWETTLIDMYTVMGGAHTHDIDFGIYVEAITGRTLSAKLYDPDGLLLKDFGVITTGETDVVLDLSSYFATLKYGMYRLELTASGRLRARCVFYELCLMYAY